MITHRQALDALTTLNEWFAQEAMAAGGANERELEEVREFMLRPMPELPPMDFAQAEADLRAAQDRLEMEIKGLQQYTVVGNWTDSRERWLGVYWARDRLAADDQARAQVQAEWEANGMEGPARFLIGATFAGTPEQADVGVKTSDD